MNEKIILKNKSFTKMFSFLVVLAIVVFCSSSALAQIQVRLNLTPDREYNSSQYGMLSWKSTTAKLVVVSTGAEVPVGTCDVSGFDPNTVTCRYSDKNAGTNKTCEITNLSLFSSATLTNAAYVLIPVSDYASVSYSKLYYDAVGAKLVSNKGEIRHKYLTATYSIPTFITKNYDGTDVLSPTAIENSSISLSGYVGAESGCYVSEITNVFAPSANAGTYNTPTNQATVNGIRIESTTPGVANNYKVYDFKVNAQINKAPISVKNDAISILNHNYDGSNTATINWANTTNVSTNLFNGIYNDDAVDLNRTVGSASFSDAYVANMKNVNITNLALANTGTFPTDNYYLTPTTALSHGNIVPTNLDTANISMTATLTYGQSLSEIINPVYTQANPSIQYNVVNWLYNGIVSNTYIPKVNETGTIQARIVRLLSGVIDSNYNSGIISVSLTVSPKSISVKDNAISINDKTYDGGNSGTINWANTTTVSSDLFNGIVGNDVVDLNRTIIPQPIVTFTDVNVGPSKTVNITNLALATGGDAQNYTLTPTTANSVGNIVPSSLDPTLAITTNLAYGQHLINAIPIYTQVNPSIQYQIESWIFNGIDSNSYQPIVNETGTIQARVSKLIAGVGSGIDQNYSSATIPVTLTVSPKSITIDGITVNNKIYDGENTASINTANVTYNTFSDLSNVIVTRNGIIDNLTFDFSALTANFADANVGISKNVTISSVSPAVVTLGGTDKANYTLSSYNTTSTANITKAPYVTMKLKDAKIFDTIDYPTSFAATPVATDFDFIGFINLDQATFVSNFAAEDFRYRIAQNGIYKSVVSPQPGTYNVVVNKATDTDSLRDNSAIILTNATNISTLANYEGIKFVVSERTQVVNSTPVTVIFPNSQNITEYGWQTKEIYTATAINGEQIVTTISHSDPNQIYVYAGTSGTDYIAGTFKWVYPSSYPNVSAFPGDTASYIFLPDVSYGGAYGDTIFGIHHILLTKADLAIKVSPSTLPIRVGQTVGDAAITSPSGEVIHKNKGITVYSSSLHSTIGSWSYVDSSAVMNAVGTYPKEIRFTLTSSLYLRNYNSPVTTTDLGATATANIAVSPAINNVNPNGVRFEIPYGTKICVAETMPTFDLTSFILPNKVNAYPGTFKFIESTNSGYNSPVVNMDNNIILYRPTTSEDTTLWVTYTPNDTNYAPEQFQVKVKVTPKVLHYSAPNYTKVYDGIATFGFNTNNNNLIANQIIDRSGVYDNITFDSLSYELDSKNVGSYTQANIVAGTVFGRLNGNDNYNYVLAPMPDLASVNVTPANLLVNITSDSISIREAIPEFNVVWSGFVPGEGLEVINDNTLLPIVFVYGSNSYRTGDLVSNIGSGWIKIPNGKYTALSNNYTITLPSYAGSPAGNEQQNVLTVVPAKIKIIAQNRSRVYGEITDPVYFIDRYPYDANPNYYDFDVYEYRTSTDSILINNAEKQSMFLQTPSIGCDSNTLNRQVGNYPIILATNTQLRLDSYGNAKYEILEHVNGILKINKATPRVLTLPTTVGINYGGDLSNIALIGGSVTHPYVGSDLATNGHFEWDTITNFRPTVGLTSYPVKYVVDDTRNYNNAIYNNQYNDSVNGYYNWTPVSLDQLSGASFRANITINKVTPTIIWPTTTMLNYGQTLATALPTPNNGSTYNPIDPNPTFTWIDSDPNNVYPPAGIKAYGVKYIPSNSNYDSLKTTIPVYTNKTTPTLNGSAVVANYSYGQTLSSNIITASFINTYNNVTVDGTINWVNGTLIPVNSNTYAARFTPTDQSNYNDKIIYIQVTVDPITPTVVSWPSVSSLVYGQNIEDASISGGLVVNTNNTSNAINGRFEWLVPSTPAITGTNSYVMQFTPTDLSKYNAITGNVSIYTAKATPVVTISPISSKVYGYTLAERGLTINTAKNNISHISSTENRDVAGTINWNLSSTTFPTVNNDTYLATFTPSESNNYNSVEIPVYVLTTKATPLMNPYTVNNYNNGQKLNVNSINLSTIPAYNQISNANVNGVVSWNSPDVTPVNGNSYLATFRPEDQINYTSVVLSIPVTVISVKPVVSWPAVSSLTYGQKLNDVDLMGGSAVNPNNNTVAVAGNFVWETPDSIPNVSNSSYTLRFIPTDTTMLETTTNITVNVLKATPVIKIATNVANDVYGKTLSQRGLPTVTASNVVNHRTGEINENAISGGTISWVSNNVRPTVNQEIYLVNYTPANQDNYNSVNNIPVSVITTKATPTVTLAALNAYSYGQTLSTKTLQIATEQNTSLTPVLTITPSGRVAWNEPNTIPVNGSTHQVNYTPNDVDNYNDTILNVTITVNTSVPSITLPVANNLVYGQKLEDADLTNGVARNVYTNESIAGTFTFATPSLVPSASSVGVSQTVVFTPSDLTKYSPVNNLSVNVFTAKATPVVTVNSLASQVYGKTLLQRSSNPIHTAKNIVLHRLNTEELTITTDTIIWSIPATVPTVAQETYTATYSVTGANAANYNTVQVEVVVPTTKATPTVTLAALNAYNYGQTLSTQTLQIATEQNTSLTPALTITPSGRVTWNEPNTIPVNGSTHQVNYTPNDVDNYNDTIIDVTVNVNPSTPVVTFPIASNLTYGQLLADADLTNGSARNQYSNESVAGTFSFVTPTTLTSASVNNGISANQVIFTPSDLTKHTTLSGTVDVFTAKATPVVTPNVVATDSYGKTLSQRLPSATAKNVISHRTNLVEQSLTGSILWNTPTTIPTVAEENFTATYSVIGADSSNYNKVQVEVMVPTTKATPVVNGAAVAAYTYGEALPSKEITVTNVVNPNDASLVLTGGTITWNSIDTLPNAGSRNYYATYTPSQTNLANYTPAIITVPVTVYKAHPAVTWPVVTPITYGETLANVALTGSHYAVNTINSADVPGIFVWASATTVTPSNASPAYRLRFIPNDLVNYYTDSTMINLIINKAVPTINWGTFSPITYGKKLSDITITGESVVNPITGNSITGGTFTWINSTIEPNVNNSGFVRIYTPADLANYETVQSGLLPVVVNKANPVVTQTSSPYTITYGQVLPSITATAINPNNNASVNGNYDWVYDSTVHLPQAGAGTYQVRFSPIGIDAENYNIVNNAFNVQVNKAKPVLIAPTSTSLVYEQTLAESELNGGSAMNSYSNDAVAGTFTWVTSSTIPDAGNNVYPVVFVPQDQNNYINSDPIDVAVAVAKKHIDIEIYDLVHIYDKSEKEASFRDAAGRVDLTGMIDAKYYKGNSSSLIAGKPSLEGDYRVIATILPTENYEGCDTAVLIINKNVAGMTNPEDEVEIVNAIVPGKNQYFKIRDYEQMTPVVVRMVNANGNQVYQSDNYTNNFDMSNLPKGTYFYTVKFTIKGIEYNKTGRVEVVGK